MRLQVQKSTNLRDLLREVGVPEPQLTRACREIAEANPGLNAQEPLPQGSQVEIPDMYFRDSFQAGIPGAHNSAATGPLNATLAGAVAGSQKVGILRGRDLQVSSAAPPASPTLERGSLEAMDGLAEALSSIDRGEVDLVFPLRPGVWSIPTPSGTIQVKAENHAHMEVTAEVAPGRNGLRIQGAAFSLSPPLVLENLDALTKDLPLGFLARAAGRIAPKVALEGLRLEADGSLTPRFCLAGSPGIKVPIPNLVLPRIEMDAKNLLSGDYFQSLGLLPLVLGATDAPVANPAHRVETGEFVRAFGAITKEGRFRIHAEGNGSLVDFNGTQARVRRSDAPFSLTVEGDLHASDQGLVTLMSEIKGRSDLGAWQGGLRADAQVVQNQVVGRVNLEGEATPGERLKKISLSTDPSCPALAVSTLKAELRDREIALEIGGRTASLIEDIAGKTRLQLGDGMDLHIRGNALVAADFAFRIEPDHIAVTDGEVSGRLELGGTEGEKALKGIVLTPGSSIQFRADVNADLEGDALHFQTPHFQISVDNASVQRGPLGAALKNGRDQGVVQGSGAIELYPNGPAGSLELRVDARARPKLLGIPAPIQPGVQGDVRLEVTPNGTRVLHQLGLKW